MGLSIQLTLEHAANNQVTHKAIRSSIVLTVGASS
jgi:hypothetical protein